jgi:hypothetical protein
MPPCPILRVWYLPRPRSCDRVVDRCRPRNPCPYHLAFTVDREETGMARTTHTESGPGAERSAIDRHAVRAVGDLLMLGAWLERGARRVSQDLGVFRPDDGRDRSERI